LQRTLKSPITFTGTGLHSGEPAKMIVHPAAPEYGIWFKRSDVSDRDAMIPALWDAVNQSPLCTRLENADGVSLSTVEHIMAALAGCGVHNALIEVNGPEVPILDGSSAIFVRAILQRGLVDQGLPVQAIEILKPIEVRKGEAWARLEPGLDLTIDFHIDFEDAAIGVQHKTLKMANGSFVRELCDSRTFCRKADVDYMRENGLALGGTLMNAVVVEGDKVLSPGGLRHSDEPVRHKMLDALGDLALAGAPILGRYTGYRAGHAMTNDLLRAMYADVSTYRMVACDAGKMARLPGVGAHLNEMPAVA
jgi:UDP-3-O-[3-hydroxymyristoyl] N-acetylglucosamine deacetylase